MEKLQQESTKEIKLESRNETLQPESKSTSRKVWAETVNSIPEIPSIQSQRSLMGRGWSKVKNDWIKGKK